METAFRVLLSTCSLAGPDFGRTSMCDFSALCSRSKKRLGAIPHLGVSASIFVSRWAKALFSMCASSTAFSAAWGNCYAASQRYWRCQVPTSSDAPPVATEVLSSTFFPYFSTDFVEKDELVAPIVASCVAMPPKPHEPVPLLRYLPWPFNQIFGPEGFELLKCRSKVFELPNVGGYESFASEDERATLLRGYAARSMVSFMSLDHAAVFPNAQFGLWKSPDRVKQRALADMRRDNSLLLGMDHIQQLYDRYLAGDPGRAATVGARPKAFDLVEAESFADLPHDVWRKCESDLFSYFDCIALPSYMWGSTRLRPVRAVSVGLDAAMSGEWVVPCLSTAPMGFIYSALFSQLIHEALVVPPLSRRVRYRAPGRESRLHLEYVDSLETDGATGGVSLTSAGIYLPRSHGLAKVAVPESAFSLELAPARWTDSDCIVVQGYDMRTRDLELVMHQDRLQCSSLLQFVYFVYLDDSHNFWLRGMWMGSVCEAAANATHLRMGVTLELAGFLVQCKKFLFAHSRPTPSLGLVTYIMCPYVTPPATLVFRSPDKLQALVRETDALVSDARQKMSVRRVKLVRVRTLMHLVSSWVHALLIARHLLSGFDAVFKATGGRSPNKVIGMGKSLCDELDTVAGLAPVMCARLSPWCDRVSAFDASSNGFGVAFKKHCPKGALLELIAKVEPHGRWSSFSTDEHCQPAGVRVARPFADEAATFLQCDWDSDANGWRASRSGPWLYSPRHIQIKELLAGEMVVSGLATLSGVAHRLRNLAIGDNQPCIGALAKGRSSIPDMNRICRRVAALCVFSCMRMRWVWVRSESNPGDGPSRWEHLWTWHARD